jgi:hypothetical protein
MGSFYRSGRLISAETFRPTGTRTLAAATESDLWSGVAATRPWPASEQLRIVSTSAEDDLLKAAITDVWDVTVAGALAIGDVAGITINGVLRAFMASGGDTNATVATGLINAVNNGAKAVHTVTPAGGYDVGDTFRVTIGATSYNHVCGAADTTAIVVTGLVAAINAGAGDPVYTAVDAATMVVLVATVGGVSATPIASVPVDTNADATLTRAGVVTGTVASTDYTAASGGVGIVSLTNIVTGTTADTVTSAMAVDPGLNSTCTAVHTTTGVSAVAGTGLQTLRIAYLDANGAEQVETVSMNGTTLVLTTATDVTAINSITGASFGSTGAAVGAVSVKDVAAAVIFGTVAAALTQDDAAMYRVPVRKKAYIASIDVSAGAVATTVKLKSDCNPATGAVVSGATFVWGTAVVGTDPATVTPATPWGPFPAAAKIWLTGTSAAGTACQGALNGYLEPAQ